MTVERFRELWDEWDDPSAECHDIREALTALIHSEAMRAKAEIDCDCTTSPCQHDWTDAEWTRAAWEKYLGRQP